MKSVYSGHSLLFLNKFNKLSLKNQQVHTNLCFDQAVMGYIQSDEDAA